ncbi:MAG TPA: hypothetical protein VHZ73_08250 [Vicinamibacterales bacterium]|jgi:hypothetical protein|nr:hypothetical protein [Vicinamibacterales bacterium]
MFEWFARRRLIATRTDDRRVTPAMPMRAMSGKYVLLHKYLENRYANSVVLTFMQIEDLLGFALPDQARRDRDWWTDADRIEAGSRHSDAWRLASRTALPNLPAQIVAFDRAS